MKVTTILWLAIASAAAQGAFAQNGAGTGPPMQSPPSPGPTFTIPIPLPQLLPIRLAAIPIMNSEVAIVGNAHRRWTRKGAGSTRQA